MCLLPASRIVTLRDTASFLLAAFGDGSTSLMLMIAEGLREAKKVTGGR